MGGALFWVRLAVHVANGWKFLESVAKYGSRWILGVFFTENMFVFGERSPERVPPETFCNIPIKHIWITLGSLIYN